MIQILLIRRSQESFYLLLTMKSTVLCNSISLIDNKQGKIEPIACFIKAKTNRVLNLKHTTIVEIKIKFEKVVKVEADLNVEQLVW